MKKALLLLLACLLAVGAGWERVDQAHVDAADNSYSVDLPVGWIRFVDDAERISVTRDGFTLNRIDIRQRSLDAAFPVSEQRAHAGLAPVDVAALEVAEVKSANEKTAFEVKTIVSADISGLPGYRLLLQFRNNRGLLVSRLVYGLVTRDSYFTLEYVAPALHYFARDLPTFEQAVGSFKVSGSAVVGQLELRR